MLCFLTPALFIIKEVLWKCKGVNQHHSGFLMLFSAGVSLNLQSQCIFGAYEFVCVCETERARAKESVCVSSSE